MNKNKAFIIAILLVALVFILAKVNFLSFKTGDILTVAGLAFAAWQTILSIVSARESQINKMQDTIEDDLSKLKENSDRKDFYHEQELNKLSIYASDIKTQLEFHTNQAGHQMMVEQILQIKDALSDLRASVAVITRQGEISLKLEKMQIEINKLKEEKKS